MDVRDRVDGSMCLSRAELIDTRAVTGALPHASTNSLPAHPHFAMRVPLANDVSLSQHGFDDPHTSDGSASVAACHSFCARIKDCAVPQLVLHRTQFFISALRLLRYSPWPIRFFLGSLRTRYSTSKASLPSLPGVVVCAISKAWMCSGSTELLPT